MYFKGFLTSWVETIFPRQWGGEVSIVETGGVVGVLND